MMLKPDRGGTQFQWLNGVAILAGKDLYLLLRDRQALLILLALPLVFITIIGFSVGELLGTGTGEPLKIAVVEETDHVVSHEILESLRRRPGVELVSVADTAAAQRAMDRRQADIGLVLGADFATRLQSLRMNDVMDTRYGPLADGLSALDVHLLRDDSNPQVAEMAEPLVYGEMIRVVGPWVSEHHGPGLIRVRLKRLREARENDPPPPPDVAAVTVTPKLSYQRLVPSYTVLFVFFLVTIMARSFLSEREQGTLKRLRMAPLTSLQLLLGKTLPFFGLSIVQTLLLFLAGHLFFGMSWGTAPWLLLPVMMATSFAATALGLLTATLVRTDSQVSAYAIFLLLTLGAVSGCLVPRDFLPTEMQDFSLVTPHAWSLIAFGEILKANTPDIALIARCCGALAMFSLLFLSIGCQRFNRYGTM